MVLEAIKKRREHFDNTMREHLAAIAACPEDREDCGYCDVCEKAEQVANEFWSNIEDDEAALIEEVERLHAELARFHECKGFEAAFLESEGKNGIRECRKAIWHREKE